MSFGIKIKYCFGECKMGEETMARSFITKCSHRTKAEMAVVKAEKAIAKEVRLAKQATTTELSSAKKLLKTPKGEREETSRPLNPKSGEGGASTKKEASKGKSSKDNIQVVEQFGSTSNSLKSNEEEKENPKVVNIPKKSIKASKWMEKSRGAQEALEAQAAQETQAL